MSPQLLTAGFFDVARFDETPLQPILRLKSAPLFPRFLRQRSFLMGFFKNSNKREIFLYWMQKIRGLKRVMVEALQKPRQTMEGRDQSGSRRRNHGRNHQPHCEPI
jgi:hypothetical protein